MVIFADDRTHMWNVVIYGLPAPEPGKMCQFWFITGNRNGSWRRGEDWERDAGVPHLPMPPSGGQVDGSGADAGADGIFFSCAGGKGARSPDAVKSSPSGGLHRGTQSAQDLRRSSVGPEVDEIHRGRFPKQVAVNRGGVMPASMSALTMG